MIVYFGDAGGIAEEYNFRELWLRYATLQTSVEYSGRVQRCYLHALL